MFAGLAAASAVVVLISAYLGDVFDEPLVSKFGRNHEAATALSFAALSFYVYFLVVYFGFQSSAFFFLTLQAMYYLPIPFLTDFADAFQVEFLVFHMLFFLILNIAFMVVFPPSQMSLPTPQDRRPDGNTNHLLAIAIAVVSILMTALYYQANGGLIYQRSGAAALIADTRLSYYANGKYTYAGYANQFKNLLLPMSLVIWLTSLTGNWRRLAILPTIVIIFLATTGTGQRAPLMFAAISLSVFSVFYYRYRLTVRQIVIFLIVIQAFGFLSSLQGRVTEFSIFASFSELFQRRFLVNQSANLETYWYVVERGHRFGLDWIQDILSLAPSIKPDTLPRELFGVLWGSSDRGNSPPSLVTTLYFNFWIPGLLILPFLMAWAARAIDKRLRSNNTCKTQVMILAFMLIALSSWTSGSILTVLNAGLITFLLYFLLSRIKLKSRAVSRY